MKIIVRSSDHVVVYAGDSLSLTPTGVVANDWIDPNFNTGNATLTEVESLPSPWAGGVWAWVGGAFVVADQARHDAISASAVPGVVTRAQFKLALLDLGLLDDVDALVAASNDRELQVNWAERLEFERNHPLVIATAAALGNTEAEIDALFVLAATK